MSSEVVSRFLQVILQSTSIPFNALLCSSDSSSRKLKHACCIYHHKTFPCKLWGSAILAFSYLHGQKLRWWQLLIYTHKAEEMVMETQYSCPSLQNWPELGLESKKPFSITSWGSSRREQKLANLRRVSWALKDQSTHLHKKDMFTTKEKKKKSFQPKMKLVANGSIILFLQYQGKNSCSDCSWQENSPPWKNHPTSTCGRVRNPSFCLGFGAF